MTSRYMMTAFGKDRVGIVADVTRMLYENDCNLEDTTMNVLSDEFTLNLLFTSKEPNLDEPLSRECRRLEFEKGISAYVRALPDMDNGKLYGYHDCTLHIECLDQVGIVYKTSKFLAERNLNIAHFNSTAKASPESGVAVHYMDIHIQVPGNVALDKVEDELNVMADELQVDIHLSR